MILEKTEQTRAPDVAIKSGSVIYLYNLQGDVIALLDTSGNVVVEYQYDAWGKIIGKSGTLAGTLGTVQPFRYRGYVYDEETGLYYLLKEVVRFQTSVDHMASGILL